MAKHLNKWYLGIAIYLGLFSVLPNLYLLAVASRNAKGFEDYLILIGYVILFLLLGVMGYFLSIEKKWARGALILLTIPQIFSLSVGEQYYNFKLSALKLPLQFELNFFEVASKPVVLIFDILPIMILIILLFSRKNENY